MHMSLLAWVARNVALVFIYSSARLIYMGEYPKLTHFGLSVCYGLSMHFYRLVFLMDLVVFMFFGFLNESGAG